MSRGGERAGVGRSYNPWARVWLSYRYARLKRKLHKEGERAPGTKALCTLHNKHGKDCDLEATRRYILRGSGEANFIDLAFTKACNDEPLTQDEQAILDRITLTWRRRHRRWRRRG